MDQSEKIDIYGCNAIHCNKNYKTNDAEPANFESAVQATGFGKFNIFLMLLIIPTAFSHVFETTIMSFVLPVAQCDLHLTLEDKGMLNAITFAGMITSGFFWGYLCDTIGRRHVMIAGYLLDGFFVIMASASQNFTMLMTAKFFGGLIINGPFSAATSYLSEFHTSTLRARVQLVRGTTTTLGNIALPLLAWAVLPRDLNFTLFNYLNFHSWNVFLLICSLAPLSSAIIFIFMPESPKFLMTTGRKEEALKVFQMMYKLNTGKSADTYPIKTLIDESIQMKVNDIENNTRHKSKKKILEILYKIKPLFNGRNLIRLLHACSNAFILLMSINTLKLWLPQLFQAINDYTSLHNGSSSNMCDMLEFLNPKTKDNNSSACDVNLNNSSVYINSIIVGATQIISFGVAGFIVNLFGKKKLSILVATASGCSATCIYFAKNSETVLALSSMFLATGGVCNNILVTITLELFPTNLRAMALSIHMMSARLGSVVGNLVFPVLIQMGCAPPFLYIGLLSFASACMSILYKNTENKALE